MIAASKGRGLVFFNNPNNPTATVHGAKTVADFVTRVRKASPDTVILIDEAYHEYVTDPSYADRGAARARDPERLRGADVLEGVRDGGHADRLCDRPGRHDEAARALQDALQRQRLRRRRGAWRRSTTRSTSKRSATQHRGPRFYDQGARRISAASRPSRRATSSSWTSARPAKDFREACAKQGVMVGRDFPPFEKTHARISIGTMDEMQKAAEVFRSVLRPVTSTGGRIEEAPWR